MSDSVSVLVYNHYMGANSQTVYGQQYYCGACRRKIGGSYNSPYSHVEYPEELEADNQTWAGHGQFRADRELMHFMFCPWCGVQFVDEWWMDRTIQNERPIDHFQNPGHHKGDTAIFPGTFEGHYLATNGDKLCWCDPVVVPGLMGCEIMHQDKAPPARVPMTLDDDWDD